MTYEIAITYGVLLIAIALFVTEWLRSDLIAILVMLLLPWLNILSVPEAFSGLASNAVISVMAVMVIGYGIDQSGIMKSLSSQIVKAAGSKEKKLMVYISLAVGLVSSFMQNIGAAALFLPAIRKITTKSKIHPSKLIMPMGFAAILGGTITMVASGPLIVLNDLVVKGGQERFKMFDVAPIGMILLIGGIGLFYFWGDKLLPKVDSQAKASTQEFLKKAYSLPDSISELVVSDKSALINKSLDEVGLWDKYNLHVLALWDQGSVVYSPWRKTKFSKGQVIAVLGEVSKVNAFAIDFGVRIKDDLEIFGNIKDEEYAGFAEVIVPPKSIYEGKSICQIGVRKNFNVEPILFIDRSGSTLDFFQCPLEVGREMVVFGRWEDIYKLKESRDFVVVTDVTKPQVSGSRKAFAAVASLLASLVMILLGVSLSLAFMSGAFMMVLLGVVKRDELYAAIDWKTVFLLAGLIPLGVAFDKSGAAAYTASLVIERVSTLGVIPIMLIIGLLTTIFSLFMSNVAATVLLVPFAMLLGRSFGIDQRGLALLVAICASNSFVLPTHQVNAFLMGPGGYSSRDFTKAGGVMSVMFLILAVLGVYVLYI